MSNSDQSSIFPYRSYTTCPIKNLLLAVKVVLAINLEQDSLRPDMFAETEFLRRQRNKFSAGQVLDRAFIDTFFLGVDFLEW